MDLGAHAGFIIGAYAVVIAVVGLLIVWVVLDHRAQHRALAELQPHGRTRSDRAVEP